MTRETTAAAILAGGRARRFDGQDKSRLIVGGQSIIVRQVDVLQRLASEILVVGPAPTAFRDLPVAVVPDRIADAGVLGGLFTALDAASREVVVTVACDQPFLHEGVLGRLVDLAMADDADGAWVRTARGVEPLIAAYRRRARAAMQAAIARGEFAAHALGGVLRMRELTGAELAAFGPIERTVTNLNTPADYARVQYPPA